MAVTLSEEPRDHRSARSILAQRAIRQPPCFVGNGRGVMTVVLVTAAGIVVALTLLVAVMIERGWTWLNAPFSIDRPLQPAVTTPAPDPSLANRGASGNIVAAFGPDSYPAAAIRFGVQGRTVAMLAIDAGGRPTQCVVRTSSGSRALDRATCEGAMERARFAPARDGHGRAIPSIYRLPVRWVLPPP